MPHHLHDILNQLTSLRTYLIVALDYLGEPNKIKEFLGKGEKAAATIETQIAFTKEYQEMGVKEPSWHDIRTSVTNAKRLLPLQAVRVEVDCPD